MSEKALNGIFTVALLAILAMNSVLIYKSFISPAQSFNIQGPTASPQEKMQQNHILVTGTGIASAIPNRALVYLGVKTQAKTASEAQAHNAVLINAVFDDLKKNGITESDMETIRYTLDPLMIYPEREEPKIVGYICQNNIVVTVKDISQTGKLIDTAVEAGANVVDLIQFTISDDKSQELYEQALKNAIADAAKKADTISKSLNAKIIGPTEVSIGSSYEPYPVRFESDLKAGTTIIPGELKITVSVQVSYQYV